MIAKNAVELADPAVPGYYSHIFVVPKNSGGWRPVINLSALNPFVHTPTFSMETAESIRLALPQDAWVVSLDLKDAFFHILFHPRSCRFLCFAYQGQVWQFHALPFGLSSAPWILNHQV